MLSRIARTPALHAQTRAPSSRVRMAECAAGSAESSQRSPVEPAPYTTGFTPNYNEAMTMSQLYTAVEDRPVAIPLEEHEERRRRRDTADIVEAAARKGMSREAVVSAISQMHALLPDIVNLDRIKASDWVKVLSDVGAVAAKLVVLKSVFPGASALRIVTKCPKMLLLTTQRVQSDAEQVAHVLANVPARDSIMEAAPDCATPEGLARALSALKAAMPSADPLEVLAKTPDVLYSLGGEGNIEDSAEYGELSTKD
ncbi:hypothetical protein FOA52_010980 [Chlamydomonas sp. UWO 241]|nr:hypothetical protein FOA52_010980 [Chlamydomonas sp. UWO 241]